MSKVRLRRREAVGSININTGRGNSISEKGRKAAETRANNTMNETGFIAKTYFEFMQFSRGTGVTSMAEINSNFDNMIQSYIQLGKIKRESYNRFKGFIQASNISPISMTKDAFVEAVCSSFDGSLSSINSNTLNKFEKDFFNLLAKYNMNPHVIMGKILFISLGKNIADMYKDKRLSDYFSEVAVRAGVDMVNFKSPEVLVSKSDGCTGSRDIYGSVWNNMDKLRQ